MLHTVIKNVYYSSKNHKMCIYLNEYLICINFLSQNTSSMLPEFNLTVFDKVWQPQQMSNYIHLATFWSHIQLTKFYSVSREICKQSVYLVFNLSVYRRILNNDCKHHMSI